MAVVAATARSGTPDRVTQANTRGALPCTDRPYNARVAANRLALPADRIAIRITAFIIDAATEMPATFERLAAGDRPVEWHTRMLKAVRDLTVVQRAQVDA